MSAMAKAFIQAQREFGPALKTSSNPHFRSRYADLSACVEAVIDALNNNNIALMQKTYESDTGVIVETIFFHESGETISSGKLHVPATKQDAQGYGSALTYARRYSLMAACGIAPEDDDGNAAVASTKTKQEFKKSVDDLLDSAPPKVHAKLDGKPGEWQLKVTEEGDWDQAVKAATMLLLDLVSSVADVTNIFKNNRNIYDKLKVEHEPVYNEIMEIFRQTKAKFTEK